MTSRDSASGVVEPLLDHLVYAVPDLAVAVDRFEILTGLRPAAGGRHLGLGTRNFLVGLGPTAYLEIIGPDVEHPPGPEVAVPFGVDRVTAPRLLTWAVHPVDLDGAVSRFAAAGADLGAPRSMSRRTPDGALLRWRLATALPLPFDGVVPFLIDLGLDRPPGGRPRAAFRDAGLLGGGAPGSRCRQARAVQRRSHAGRRSRAGGVDRDAGYAARAGHVALSRRAFGSAARLVRLRAWFGCALGERVRFSCALGERVEISCALGERVGFN